MYRDGVGNGQLKTLIEYEVPQLLSSVTEAGSNPRYQVIVLPLHSDYSPFIITISITVGQHVFFYAVKFCSVSASGWIDLL